MTEVGKRTVEGVALETRRGTKHGPRDRVLFVDGRKITFSEYLRGIDAGRWPTKAEEEIRQFFYTNESVAVAPRGFGAGMLKVVEGVLRDQGLKAALALEAKTRRPGFRRSDILAAMLPDVALVGEATCGECGKVYVRADASWMELCHACWTARCA